jgi:DNA-binding beta-propeller fold protein YncE
VYLLVGDTEAKTLSAYNTENNTLVGTLTNIVMNSHAGTVPLPDGSVLLVDDEGSRLLKVGMHDDHFEILAEAAITGHVAHMAIESDHAHTCAIGTSGEDDAQLHLIDLESWNVTSLQLADAGEVGLMMTHDHLFHRNSNLNRVEAYDLASLLSGEVTMLGSVEIGTFGHGEAINEETGELFMLTDDGVDIAYWDEQDLTFGKTLPWPQTDAASRGYFCRLVADGAALLTYTADRSASETEWQTWKNRSVLYNISTGYTIITDLPDGYVFRYALTEATAVFTVIGGESDALITIDTDPDSETFGGILTTTAIDRMENGARPGDAFYETGSYRALAASPDGHMAFITQGGEGLVYIFDPEEGAQIATLEHPTPLNGGGTLAVFGTAVPTWDTIGR